MTRYFTLATLIFGIVMAARTGIAADEPIKPMPTLGDRPEISLLSRPPASDAKKAHIRELIASFASLDKPDFGLSPTMSGSNFAPLPDQKHPRTFLMTDHGLEGSSSLNELVTLGPEALPFLLDALDNQTPTKVVINHEGGFGGMWFARETPVNPVNPAEASILKEAAERGEDDPDVSSYTVKIGDVCFVAIGQIVGREYDAVRYQPTACTVLNCPTHDAKLCARIRTIWKSDDPTRKLFDSLCADYATVGGFNGQSLDGWDVGNSMQCSAALRMHFYFPAETAPLLVARLDKLNVAKDVGLDDYMRRCVANQVRSEEFIKSLVWSKNPAIRAALARVFSRAEDNDSLMAALPAADDKELIRRKLEAALIALPGDDSSLNGDAHHLLTALIQHSPDTAKAMFDRYLQFPIVERRHTVCVVLRDVKMKGDIDVLAPLLLDVRTFGWTYPIGPGQNDPRLPVRICDEAAVTLSQNHPELKFTQAGRYVEMDRQIAVMRDALTGRK